MNAPQRKLILGSFKLVFFEKQLKMSKTIINRRITFDLFIFVFDYFLLRGIFWNPRLCYALDLIGVVVASTPWILILDTYWTPMGRKTRRFKIKYSGTTEYIVHMHKITVETSFVTQFLVLQKCVTKRKCVTKEMSEKFCDDALVNQLNLFYQIFDVFSSSPKFMINK